MRKPTHTTPDQPSRGGRATHRTVIESDAPLEVRVGESDDRWFRLYSSVVRSGAWAGLSGSAAKVLVSLAAHASRETWLAWPSVATLAKLSGLSRGSVFRGLAELEAARLIQTRAQGGGNRATTYELTPISDAPAPAPTPRQTRLTGATGRAHETGRAGATGSAGETEGSRRRDGRGSAGATLTTQPTRQGTTAAASLVCALGMSEREAAALVLEVGADEGRVADALASLEAARARKGVANPRAWVAAFLRGGWAPDESVERARRAAQAGERARERAEREAMERAELERVSAEEAGRRFAALERAGADELERARREALEGFPPRLRARFEGVDPREPGESGIVQGFRLRVAERLGSGAAGSLASVFGGDDQDAAHRVGEPAERVE